MADKIFVVSHIYDVDGGFGDAVTESEIIGYFPTKEEADEFVKKYSEFRVYAKPYSTLCWKGLAVKEVSLLDPNRNPFDDVSYDTFRASEREYNRLCEEGYYEDEEEEEDYE